MDANEILQEDERVQKECDVAYKMVCMSKDWTYKWETPYFEYPEHATNYAHTLPEGWTDKHDTLVMQVKVKGEKQ